MFVIESIILMLAFQFEVRMNHVTSVIHVLHSQKFKKINEHMSMK